ncbi:MAG TPA: Tim44-like domain-containing protein [Oxalicibacterium sp.]|nr:Tim44-like domain-containing protein [Oxalicibacterium sp.]
MKKLLMAAVVSLSALMLVAPQADAKRMGGGGSFGKQSQSFKRQAPPQYSQPSNAAKPAAAPNAAGAGAAAAAKPSMWKGMLGGALLGLGLGALLSHLGIGGALASMISTVLMIALIGFVIMFVIRMVRNRGNQGGTSRQPSYANGYREEPMARSITPEIGSGLSSATSAAAGAATAASDVAGEALPADFDVESFLRHAKTYFIRLQAAWDKGDVNDIREFTTPEMFAELRLQLQERGASPNVTDVVSLDAVFYGVETVGDEYIASVKFSGMIREADHAPTEPFTEAWNLAKPVNGNGGWVLAGIQQLS